MIEQGKTYVVMGLLDAESIAYAIGSRITELGGKVIYTAQNERMKRLFLDRSKKLTDEEKSNLDIRFCDVTQEGEVRAVFDAIGSFSGLVHSLAYVNPKTGLGEEFHTDAIGDLMTGFHISAVSLATVARHAYSHMGGGGSIVALTFDTKHVYSHYNWMGVNKAALEAIVRALSRRHGKDRIRVNAVSAGPLATKAAVSIPGFAALSQRWEDSSPLPWDLHEDKKEVAHAVAFLLGPCSKKITGQVLYVDGGASVIGGELAAHER